MSAQDKLRPTTVGFWGPLGFFLRFGVLGCFGVYGGLGLSEFVPGEPREEGLQGLRLKSRGSPQSRLPDPPGVRTPKPQTPKVLKQKP